MDDDSESLAHADIHRMDGACIFEDWDISQARPANSTNPYHVLIDWLVFTSFFVAITGISTH